MTQRDLLLGLSQYFFFQVWSVWRLTHQLWSWWCCFAHRNGKTPYKRMLVLPSSSSSMMEGMLCDAPRTVPSLHVTSRRRFVTLLEQIFPVCFIRPGIFSSIHPRIIWIKLHRVRDKSMTVFFCSGFCVTLRKSILSEFPMKLNLFSISNEQKRWKGTLTLVWVLWHNNERSYQISSNTFFAIRPRKNMIVRTYDVWTCKPCIYELSMQLDRKVPKQSVGFPSVATPLCTMAGHGSNLVYRNWWSRLHLFSCCDRCHH